MIRKVASLTDGASYQNKLLETLQKYKLNQFIKLRKIFSKILLTVCIDYFHKNISNRQLWIIFFKHLSIKYLKRIQTSTVRNILYVFLIYKEICKNSLQENLECRPKNYKKVGTVVGNKLEDLLVTKEDDQDQPRKELHPDWRRNNRKDFLTNEQ